MTPLVLAIDTSSEFASLALARGGEAIDEILIHSTAGFAHLLYGQLERFLEKNGVKAEEIGCFAAAAGPGSFTGIRVALSAVKGLAESAGKKVVAVSNLEALAWYGVGVLRSPVLDARRGEVFAALYNANGQTVIRETVCGFQDWLAMLPRDEGIEFVVTDAGLFPLADKRMTAAPRSFARAVAAIAAHRFAAGLAQDPAAIDANYVRRSDAEMRWREAY